MGEPTTGMELVLLQRTQRAMDQSAAMKAKAIRAAVAEGCRGQDVILTEGDFERAEKAFNEVLAYGGTQRERENTAENTPANPQKS